MSRTFIVDIEIEQRNKQDPKEYLIAVAENLAKACSEIIDNNVNFDNPPLSKSTPSRRSYALKEELTAAIDRELDQVDKNYKEIQSSDSTATQQLSMAESEKNLRKSIFAFLRHKIKVIKHYVSELKNETEKSISEEEVHTPAEKVIGKKDKPFVKFESDVLKKEKYRKLPDN